MSYCRCKNKMTKESFALGGAFKICALSRGGCGKEILSRPESHAAESKAVIGSEAPAELRGVTSMMVHRVSEGAAETKNWSVSRVGSKSNSSIYSLMADALERGKRVKVLNCGGERELSVRMEVISRLTGIEMETLRHPLAFPQAVKERINRANEEYSEKFSVKTAPSLSRVDIEEGDEVVFALGEMGLADMKKFSSQTRKTGAVLLGCEVKRGGLSIL